MHKLPEDITHINIIAKNPKQIFKLIIYLKREHSRKIDDSKAISTQDANSWVIFKISDLDYVIFSNR